VKVIKNDRTVFFDCDDTIVMWDHENHPDALTFRDILDPDPNACYSLVPHKRHIAMLKTFKRQGFSVVVWTQGGHLWAEEVVKVLGLEEFVDIAMAKPDTYFDDIEAKDFMQRRYFKSKIVYPEDKL